MKISPKSRQVICKSCAALEAAINRYIEKADDNMQNELSDAGYVDSKKTVSSIDDLETDLEDALNDETDAAVDALSDATDVDDLKKKWKAFKDSDGADEAISKAYEDAVKELVKRFSNLYMKETSHDMTVTSLRKRTVDWIHSWAQDLGKLMKLTSHDRIEAVLSKGLENGDDIPTITRAIQEAGIRQSYGRARTTAVTEILTAHDVAHQEAQVQNPVVTKKTWRHSGAAKIKPRQNHVDMDGTTVDVNDTYTLLGADGETYYPMFPCDPVLPPGERINCHCLSQDVVDDDVLGMSLEDRKALQKKIIDEDDDAWEAELDAQNKAKAGITE